MIELKKRDIEGVLSVIIAFDEKTQAPVFGLLMEEVPLSLKRKLQKIRNEVLKAYEQLKLDESEVNEKFKAEDHKEQRELELKTLFEEPIVIQAEKASLQMIEAIRTKNNYDFTVIEKIAE